MPASPSWRDDMVSHAMMKQIEDGGACMPALEGKPTDDEVHLIAQYHVVEVPAVRLPPVPGPPDPRAPTQPADPDQPEPVYPNKEPDDPGAPHEPEPDDPLRLNVDPRRQLQATR
jgi:hypothetical protein